MSATNDAPPTGWNPERFKCNLAALAVLQPDVAQRLDDLPIPTTVEPALGRDGHPTFRLAGDAGKRWLGRTSMPSVSAPGLIEHFDAGGANAILPVLGTGLEAHLLCAQLAAHRAVFAYEEDPLGVKLVMHLLDLADYLRSGRLVPLTFGPIEDVLPAFLRAHPGYDFPHRLLVHPAKTSAEFDRFRAASEAAANAVLAEQAKRISGAADAMRAQTRTDDARPRVAILSWDTRLEAVSTVTGLAAAAGELGWPVAWSAPTGPGECHNVARLQTLCDHHAGMVLTVNAGLGSLTDLVPADLPVASWFLPGSSPSALPLKHGGRAHEMFAATRALCDQLREAGVAEERVHLLEPGVNTCCYRPLEIAAERRRELECDVAIFADAVDDSAEAAGIRHESQIALWEKMRELTARRASTYTPAIAEQIVIEAERSLRIKMTADQVREKFVHVLRARLAPTTVVRALAVRLARSGFAVKLWGNGWTHDREVGNIAAGPIPSPTVCNELYQCARAVVFPLFTAAAVPRVLEVVAAGGWAILRSPDSALGVLHPQTAGVLELLPQYQTADALQALIRKAISTPASDIRRSAPACEMVAAEHSLQRRWATIRGVLRGGC
ncbi:MAG: hypothetical protein GY842_20440 [bacterium]|nr:hypothetical protein [bacterium]